MKKSTHVPKLVPITEASYGPYAIFSAANPNSCLYFLNDSSPAIKITRSAPGSTPGYWTFHNSDGRVTIRSYFVEHLCWTREGNKIFARRYSGNADQEWELYLAGVDLCCIRSASAPTDSDFLYVGRDFSEGEAVILASLTNEEELKFRLVARP